MHPLVIAAIVGGSVLGTFFIYEVASNIYEEYNERRQYEEYIRNHSSSGYGYRTRMNNDFEFDDDQTDSEVDEKEDEYKNDQYELRHRRRYSQSSMDEKNQYELSDLENSINERRRRLMAEQAFLDQEEEMLHHRREALQRSIMTDESSDNTERQLKSLTPEQENTITDSFFSNEQESEKESEKESAHGAMVEEKPAASTGSLANDFQKLNVQDKQESSSDSLYHSLASYDEPSELKFPSPSTADHTSSTVTKSNSDSEESWDAVSEEEDWLKSLNGSDEEHHFSD